MKFLSKEEFLEKFSKRNTKSFDAFMKKAKVKTSKKVLPIKDYIKDKDVNIQSLKLLFENIQTREEYLTRFYNLSLFVHSDRFSVSSVKPMKNLHFNNNEESTYKNIIRNMHWKDILKNTKSGIENVPTFLDMLEDLYLKDIIDYKIITPSSLYYMKEGRIGSIFSSYYFRASIMNPYLVYSINMSVLKGTKIFTPTLGWSSYCYGFLESLNVVEYVGTDVIPSVCKKTQKFADKHYPQKNTSIYCEPSEHLLDNSQFMNKYKNHFDVVYFSPPYYKLEEYPGKKQSTEQYKTYEEWLKKYWEATIQLCYKVLEKGGRLCYILSNYGSENTGEHYDIVKDTTNITKKYFELKSIQPMYNKEVHNTMHKETNEQILIFTKLKEPTVPRKPLPLRGTNGSP